LRKIASFFLLCTFLLFTNINAQSIRPDRQAEQKPNTETPKQFDIDLGFQQKTPDKIIPSQQYLEQALEVAVDSNSYKLGPGDLLQISVWGILENQFLTEITAEGYVVIPTISEIYVSGLTLADGSLLIKENLKRYFKKASFSIRLIKMRKFRVFVVGEIIYPGTYYLRAADRLDDAIQLAGGLTQWGDNTRIQLRHKNEKVDTLNLSDFYLSGILDENPNLDGGDIILVPAIDLQKNYAIIEGNVGSEGIYQIRPKETLFAFLTRVQALNRKSNIDNVLLIRNEQKILFNLMSNESKARTEFLQTGDRIIVPTNRDRVYVKGEVFQPGPVAYLANYKAKDYAGLAGIMETAKKIEDIYVIRMASGKIEKGGDVVVQKGDIVVVPQRGRELFKDYMSILTPIISIGLSTYAIIQASK